MLEDSVQKRLRKKCRRDGPPGSCPKGKVRNETSGVGMGEATVKCCPLPAFLEWQIFVSFGHLMDLSQTVYLLRKKNKTLKTYSSC